MFSYWYVSDFIISDISPTTVGGGYGLPILMESVQCFGSETHLNNCTASTDHDCYHVENAGVKCFAGKFCKMVVCHLQKMYIIQSICMDWCSYKFFTQKQHFC